MAGPTLQSHHFVGGASTGTLTTASMTPTSGDVVTVIGIGAGGAANNAVSAPTTTLTNGGITGLQNITAGSPAAHCSARGDTFAVTGAGAGTVSQADASGEQHGMAVWRHSNANAATAGRSASAAGSSKVLGYTPSQADSAVCWGVGDWNASAVQTETPAGTSHGTSAPGPQASPVSNTSSGQYTWNYAVLDDQTSTGSTSYGIGGSGTGPFTIVIVEVQQAAAVTTGVVLLEDGTPILLETADVLQGET